MDEDFYLWLCESITSTEQRIYEYLRITGAIETSTHCLSDRLHVDRSSFSKHLKRLQKLDLIRYTSTQSGTFIEWVAMSKGDRPPPVSNIRRKTRARRYELRSPTNKIHTIEPGRLAHFCRDNNLDYRATWRVLNGDRPHHKGWKAA